MALRLMVEGQAVEVSQAEPYCMSDMQARMWGEEGAAQRARTNRGGGEAQRVRVFKLGALERLAEDGRLRKVQVDAGREIRAYWRLWTTALFARVADYGAAAVAAGGAGADAPSVRSLVGRYRAWASEAEATRVRGELSSLQLVLDLCLRDWSPWEMRREYRIGDARALRVCQESLLHYGRLAGWQDIEREAA